MLTALYKYWIPFENRRYDGNNRSMKEEGVRIISFDSIIFIEALVIGGH